MQLNPTSNLKYSDAAYSMAHRSRSKPLGLALLADRDQQREQLQQDMAVFEKNHVVTCLQQGICQGLGKFEPENLSLFGVLNEWSSHG